MQRGSTLEQLPLSADGQKSVIDNARKSLGTIILGKDEEISLSLACLLARGHLLIEDLPGLGHPVAGPDADHVSFLESKSLLEGRRCDPWARIRMSDREASRFRLASQLHVRVHDWQWHSGIQRSEGPLTGPLRFSRALAHARCPRRGAITRIAPRVDGSGFGA